MDIVAADFGPRHALRPAPEEEVVGKYKGTVAKLRDDFSWWTLLCPIFDYLIAFLWHNV